MIKKVTYREQYLLRAAANAAAIHLESNVAAHNKMYNKIIGWLE